jgi:hypothetical protein
MGKNYEMSKKYDKIRLFFRIINGIIYSQKEGVIL